MPFEIVRNDITNMHTDIIVNAANPQPIVGYGIDSAIHQKAGKRLIEARKKIGNIDFGDAAITPAFDLDAKYVIHAVSPIWQGGEKNEHVLLESCYEKSLQLALDMNCESISFPLLSAGNHGFPKELVLQTAITVFSRFLMQHEMQIYLVVFSRDAFVLSEKLFDSVQSYIDDNYIIEKTLEEYGVNDKCLVRGEELKQLNNAVKKRKKEELDYFSAKIQTCDCAPPPLCSATLSERALDDLMDELEETFSQNLIRLIDQKGLKDPDVYKKANIDRKLFSKIKNNTEYQPSKATALAFAIALELNLDETRDFIGRAGYAITHSNKFDIIIEYFIKSNNYNIFELNEVLFAFDQPLIGG